MPTISFKFLLLSPRFVCSFKFFAALSHCALHHSFQIFCCSPISFAILPTIFSIFVLMFLLKFWCANHLFQFFCCSHLFSKFLAANHFFQFFLLFSHFRAFACFLGVPPFLSDFCCFPSIFVLSLSGLLFLLKFWCATISFKFLLFSSFSFACFFSRTSWCATIPFKFFLFPSMLLFRVSTRTEKVSNFQFPNAESIANKHNPA